MTRGNRSTPADDDSNYVEATQKSLAVLDYLKENGPSTLTEISNGLGTAKSTMFRHVKTLERAGYVAECEEGYRIGLLYLDYGVRAQRDHPLYHAAKPKVDALAERVGEKVWCMVEENGYAVYIYLKSGDELYRSFTRLGFRGHLHVFSAGKCVLAHLPEERVDQIIRQRGLPAYTEQTITDEHELREELADVRERGFALHRGEAVSGGNAVSVPIKWEDGSPAGAISVAGPAHRLSGEYLTSELPNLLLGVKNEVELSIKYEDVSTAAGNGHPGDVY